MTRMSYSSGYQHSPDGNSQRDQCWANENRTTPYGQTVTGICNADAVVLGLCAKHLQAKRHQEEQT